MLSFFLIKYLGVEGLGCKVGICLMFKKLANCLYDSIFPTVVYEVLRCSNPYQDLVWSVFLILKSLLLINVNVNFNFYQLQFAWPLQYSTPVAWPWGLSSSQALAEHGRWGAGTCPASPLWASPSWCLTWTWPSPWWVLAWEELHPTNWICYVLIFI